MLRTLRLVFWTMLLAAACASSARGQWKIDMPDGGVGVKFGNLIIPPLQNVQTTSVYSDQSGAGFVATENLVRAGGQWPDPLTGSYVGNLSGKPCQFKVKVPNGDWLVWLAAGRIIRADLKGRRYLLKINAQTVVDETPSDEEFGGEKYLYRFLATQYSEKPHALWQNYIDKMYPADVHTVTVSDGAITVETANYFLSALVAVPAAKKAEFQKMVAEIRDRRIATFEDGLRAAGRPQKGGKPWPPPKSQPGPGDPEVLLYVPRDPMAVNPWTGPSDEERKQREVNAAGALGEKVVVVLSVTPFADLGPSTLVVSDLSGPGVIPAGNVQGYYRNYRFNGKDYAGSEREKNRQMPEMCLVPSLALDLEKGVTFSYWLRLAVPADARPGKYRGTLTLRCAGGKSFPMPFALEVYPFKLEPVLPISYGFWGTVGTIPQFLPEATKKQITRERLASMVDLGLTATCVDVFNVKALKPGGTVELSVNEEFIRMVKESGMGRHPEQAQLVTNIMASMGRGIAAHLPGGNGVWNHPGIEFRLNDFEKYFKDAARQYRDYFKKVNLPVVITTVDEPRERGLNSWNRNYADTIRYCDWLRELGGIRICCNPMGDDYHGKDYTPMIEHVDVLSTHAWKNSERFMKETLRQQKTLWLYNCGRDRYSYGFYNWRWKSHGRWEWQFMEHGDGAVGGYPGREWYNPFTDLHSGTNCAPRAKCPGALLYQAQFFNISAGIADQAYLYTLEQVLKTATGAKADEAKGYLASLERAMPEFPQVHGLASPSDGPKVGMGLDDDARLKVDEWRKAVAGFIKELKK